MRYRCRRDVQRKLNVPRQCRRYAGLVQRVALYLGLLGLGHQRLFLSCRLVGIALLLWPRVVLRRLAIIGLLLGVAAALAGGLSATATTAAATAPSVMSARSLASSAAAVAALPRCRAPAVAHDEALRHDANCKLSSGLQFSFPLSDGDARQWTLAGLELGQTRRRRARVRAPGRRLWRRMMTTATMTRWYLGGSKAQRYDRAARPFVDAHRRRRQEHHISENELVKYWLGTWKRTLEWREFGGGYGHLRETNTVVQVRRSPCISISCW